MNNGDFAKFIALSKKKKEIRKNGPENKDEIDNVLRNIETLKNVMKETEHGDPYGYKKYRRLGGEAEAFMVTNRADGKQTGMPNYDTGYGYPVANFAGFALPLMSSKEMNGEVHALSGFKERVQKDLEKGWSPNSSKWTDENGITFKGERVLHAKEKHGLSDEQLDDLEASIGKLYCAAVSNKKTPGQFNGIHVIALAKGKLSCYRVNLAFMENGTVQFETAFPGKEEAIKKEIANCAPRVLASKNGASVPPGKEFAISIPNIQKELGIVKKSANRKKATDWISTEQPDWLIPKEKVDNLLSAPNVANEEDLVKLKSENPTYYQTAADKDLVVYHNVSTGKLREAIKLGGLPMPSLAITKRDIPFGDFGEITLIGDKGMIDPRKSRANEVFSRDAYTVRKPVVNYEEPAKIDSDTFHKKYEETRRFFKKNSIDVGEINFSFQSLKQLEDEAKQKIRVKTRQCNLWIIIAGGALYACISK